MANVIVFGASGKAGFRIVAEAAARGHQVVAVARQGAAVAGLPAGARVASGHAT